MHACIYVYMYVCHRLYIYITFTLLYINIALKVTKGVRYIIAGFCEYGDSSMSSFLSQYEPAYDGYAAESGIVTGDIIRAVKACQPIHEGGGGGNGDMSVVQRMVTVDEGMSDDEWKAAASSCEQWMAGADAELIVERNPRNEV